MSSRNLSTALIAMITTLWGLFPSPPKAAEFFIMPGTKQLYMLGETAVGDLENLRGFVQRDGVASVILAGPGGDLDEAFRIADYVKEVGLKTEVVPDRTCESACAFIFMSGVVRTMGEGSSIGLHLPFLPLGASFDEVIRNYVVQEYCKEVSSQNSEIREFGPCLTATYEMAFNDASQIIQLFEASGIDPKILIPLMATSPEDMFYISPEDATAANIVGDDSSYLTREEAIKRAEALQADLDKERLSSATQIATLRTELFNMETSNEDLAVRLDNATAAWEDANKTVSSIQAALDKSLEDGRLNEAEMLARLALALEAQETLEQEVAAAVAAGDQVEAEKLSLEGQLAEALLAREVLEAKVASLSLSGDETALDRAELEGQLAEARYLIDLATAVEAESRRQVDLLNEQVVELRGQIETLQELLDIADQHVAESKAQIESLGAQLNTALFRVATEVQEERNRNALAEAERTWLIARIAALETMQEAQQIKVETRDASVPPGLGLTFKEIDQFRRSIAECWIPDPELGNVTLGFMLTEAGRVIGDISILDATADSEADLTRAFQLARTAVLRCQGAGYQLPPEKYQHWRVIELSFAPEEARQFQSSIRPVSRP